MGTTGIINPGNITGGDTRTGMFTTGIIIKSTTGIGKNAMLNTNGTIMIGTITGRFVTIIATNSASDRIERISFIKWP